MIKTPDFKVEDIFGNVIGNESVSPKQKLGLKLFLAKKMKIQILVKT